MIPPCLTKRLVLAQSQYQAHKTLLSRVKVHSNNLLERGAKIRSQECQPLCTGFVLDT